jgi:hypothetical protein
MPRWDTRLTAAAALAVAAAITGAMPSAAQDAEPGAAAAKPRVLVLAFAQNEPEHLDMVHALAEAALMDLGLPLVDRAQVTARLRIADLERGLLLDPETDLLAELRTRYGADVILTVRYFRQFMHERALVGGPQRFYKTDVRVRAVSADAAAVLFTGGAKTPIQARTDGFERLVSETATAAGEAMLARWRGGEGQSRPVQVLARGFGEDALLKLETALAKMPGVQKVARRDYGGPAVGAGNALVEVQLEGATEDLARSLRSLTDPAVRVTASSAERIELEPAPAPEVGFLSPKDGEVFRAGAFEARLRGSAGLSSVHVNGTAGRPDPEREGIWLVTVKIAPGRNELRATARDAFGRSAEVRIAVVRDDTPPAARVVSPEAGLVNTGEVTVEVEAHDGDGVGVAGVRVNDVALTPADSRWTGIMALAEGPNELVVVATDRAGNETRVTHALTLDSTPPSLDATVVAIIEGKVNENGVRIVCQGKEWSVADDGSFRIAVESPVGGLVTVVAIDPAGNRTEKNYRIGREGSAEPQ